VSWNWTGYRPWTGHVELDRIELGWRVTCAYDEHHAIVYRLGEAAGYPRAAIISWLPERRWGGKNRG
jgi:hypothetical protein